ncbi:MAG TPA: DUF554 family protein, partial [Candidatus Binatus sp.]|nr:DUF554 family protein [Candidatus Binatus sp.]
SAATILVIQGSLASAAFLARGVLDDRTILVTTAVGGTILIGMALRLLELRAVRVANFLPGLLIAPIAVRVADLLRTALG